MSLVNHLLVATPWLTGPYANRELILVVHQDEKTAMGIIVNRPLAVSLQYLITHVGISARRPDYLVTPLFFGGKDESTHGFVLHTPLGRWRSTLQVAPSLGLTSSTDVLEAAVNYMGPQHLLVSLGMTIWKQGQLEDELSSGGWFPVAAKSEILFETAPETRYASALKLLGVDEKLLWEVGGTA